MYIRCHINYENRPDIVPTDFEAVCGKIKQANTESWFQLFYRPPCSPSEVSTKIERSIKSIDDDNKELYIFGDLNCNLLEPALSTTKRLQEILELYQLTQLISSLTRITQSSLTLLEVAVASMPEKGIFVRRCSSRN